jgi:hypothetical protein
MARNPVSDALTPITTVLDALEGAGKSKRKPKPKPRNRGFQHGPTITSAKPLKKPSFETAVAAKRGDKAARRQLEIWAKSQAAKKAGAARVEALTDRALFGEAESTIKGAAKTADPWAMALAEALSPTTAVLDTLKYTRKGEPGLAALSALGFIPAPRGAVAAARAARVARAEARAARVEAKVAAGFQHGDRTLHVGDKVQQLPGQAKSRVTRTVIEKPADKVSELMQGEGKVARAARKALPTASASARASKAAGREFADEAGRIAAAMEEHARALPKKFSREDVAHFYWAQLPESHRNVVGLQKVRALQAEELRRVVSGERLEELRKWRRAIGAQMRETKDTRERLALVEDLKNVRTLINDIPQLMDDIPVSLAQLDDVIENLPDLDPKIIAAVRAFSGDRRAVFEGLGKLTPERATLREGLVSRALGLEPSGEESYIGHRLADPRGARGSLLPGGLGVGRPRLPQGLSQANKGILLREGRLTPSTHIAARDWQAAQTYRGALKIRDDLGAFGPPYEGRRLAKGELLVNPKSRVIPAHLKSDPLEDLGDDAEELRAAAKEIFAEFTAGDEASVKRMLAAAREEGVQYEELRVVPANIAKRYFAQFLPAGADGWGWKTYDLGIDFVAASIVFGRIGYIPKNLVQNAVMMIPHQGIYAFANVPRAAQVMRNPRLKVLIANEVGMGATGALAKESGHQILSKPAGFVTGIADTPARTSAFLHEAAIEGVIPRLSKSLSAADEERLLDLLTNPKMRRTLNKIKARTNDAMADFGRLTPKQRKYSRRALIIPGWLMAGSRYPIHFAATHPGRSAAMAYVAAGEPGAPDELQINKPVNEYFADFTPSWMPGIPTPWGFWRTGSISPVSTPWEGFHALTGSSPETAADYFNPLPMGIIDTLRRVVEEPGGGTRRTGYGEAFQRNLLERLVPNYTFARDLINPREGGIYSDTSRLGRLKREAGILPVGIDKNVARRYKLYESGSPAEKARFNKAARLRGVFADIDRAGIKITPAQRAKIRKAFSLSTSLEAGIAAEETTEEKILAALKVDTRFNLISPSARSRVRKFLAGNPTEREKESVLNEIRGAYGGDALRSLSGDLGDLLDKRKLEPTEVKTVR